MLFDTTEQILRQIGTQLFTALFAGEIGKLYVASRSMLKADQHATLALKALLTAAQTRHRPRLCASFRPCGLRRRLDRRETLATQNASGFVLSTVQRRFKAS